MKRFLIATLVAIFIAALLPFSVSAGALGGAFGGRITDVRFCTCPPFGVVIDVSGGASSGEYVYYVGISTLYKYYLIFVSGVNVLGTASGYGTCLIGFPPLCSPIGAGPIIRKVGTSLH